MVIRLSSQIFNELVYPLSYIHFSNNVQNCSLISRYVKQQNVQCPLSILFICFYSQLLEKVRSTHIYSNDWQVSSQYSSFACFYFSICFMVYSYLISSLYLEILHEKLSCIVKVIWTLDTMIATNDCGRGVSNLLFLVLWVMTLLGDRITFS